MESQMCSGSVLPKASLVSSVLNMARCASEMAGNSISAVDAPFSSSSWLSVSAALTASDWLCPVCSLACGFGSSPQAVNDKDSSAAMIVQPHGVATDCPELSAALFLNCL